MPALSRSFGLALLPAGLAACTVSLDAPRMAYRCPNELMFQARLYSDMAVLDGLTGHVVLERQEQGTTDAPRYANAQLQAAFGLGLQQRLARLEYANIPDPVYCERMSPEEWAEFTAPDAGVQLLNPSTGGARVTILGGPPVPDAAPVDLETPVRASTLAGPRTPPPFDPNAPVSTNIRTEQGPVRVGR